MYLCYCCTRLKIPLWQKSITPPSISYAQLPRQRHYSSAGHSRDLLRPWKGGGQRRPSPDSMVLARITSQAFFVIVSNNTHSMRSCIVMLQDDSLFHWILVMKCISQFLQFLTTASPIYGFPFWPKINHYAFILCYLISSTPFKQVTGHKACYLTEEFAHHLFTGRPKDLSQFGR
jgi:hypothetical protein